MANIINKYHGKLMEAYHDDVIGNLPNYGVGPANMLWRLKILTNRLTSLKEKSWDDPTMIDPAKKQPTTKIAKINNEIRRVRIKTPKNISIKEPRESTIKNTISIINPNSQAEDGYEKIIIQGMPSEIDVSPETTWATARIPGRNNPNYFYTGAEDVITFEISWYTNQADRKDVTKNCRLLEAWSKGDGYVAPPELWISWGNGELFKDDTFILTSAKYKLDNFQNSCKDAKGTLTDLGLLPNSATQTLVFKKTTAGNQTYEDIKFS